MATIASKFPLLFAPGENETEDITGRTRTSKRFRLPDAPDGRRRFRIGAQTGPLHYQADPFVPGEWLEADIDVTLTPESAWDAECGGNGYQVRFWQSVARGGSTYRYVAQYRRAGKWLAMAPVALLYENTAGKRQLVSKVKAVGAPVIDNDRNTVTWGNAFGAGIHFGYILHAERLTKIITIDSKSTLPVPTIGLSGLKLTVVMALEWDTTAAASNGLASGIETSFGESYAETPDETLDEHGEFGYEDERGRLWWMQKPLAWDSAEQTHSVDATWRLFRKAGSVYAGISVKASALNNAQTVYPVYIDTAITEERVSATADDSYANGSTWPGYGSFSATSLSDTVGSLYNAHYCGGFRFTTVPIPEGATIDSATLGVNASSTLNNDCHLHIHGDAHDSAATWSSGTDTGTGSPGYRSRTTAYSDWNIGTTQWTAGVWYTSSDMASVVQEIVDRAGWADGNDMAFIVAYYSTTPSSGAQYRNIGDYSYSSTYAQKLNITYTEAASSGVKAYNGVAVASIGKVHGVAKASISKIGGLA